jgi:tRNA1Val (adenine37-N6)-methyltransferase
MKNPEAFANSSGDPPPADLSKTRRRDGERTSSPKGKETLDVLFDGKLSLFQSGTGYRFSLDALLLASFVTVKRRDRVIDLGTGNGVIPLALADYYPSITVTGVEIQPAMAQRARKNLHLNRLNNRIKIVMGDVRSIDAILEAASCEVVVSNPPYRKAGSGRVSPNDEKRIARHETQGDLGDFLRAGAFLLRAKGRMAMVYSAGRCIDLLSAMRQTRIEPKRMRMVHSFAEVEASLVLVEGVKGGRSGVEVLAPLTIYRRGKEYSEEVAAMIAGTRRGTVQSSRLKAKDLS